MSEDDDKSLLSSADLTSIENSSRLATEYNILGFLGSGGFGSVFLARNKLDGNDYAIKRISLGGMSQKQIERIKNEVAVFSRLTHGHIVRYYSSFIETVVMDPDTSGKIRLNNLYSIK
jgi:translation initiation factor 2-alpha kinase 4